MLFSFLTAQTGHHQIMAYHLKSAEDQATEKLIQTTQAHVETMKNTQAEHKNKVTKVRRQSVVQIQTMETEHVFNMKEMNEKHVKKIRKTKDEVKHKVRERERIRTQRKLKRANDKNAKMTIHREKLAARRAVRQRVTQLQSQIIKTDYPRGCFVCGTNFTLFLRVHHCRACGLAVCDACSVNRISCENLKLTRDQLQDALAKEDSVGCGGGGGGGSGGSRSGGNASLERGVLTQAALEEHGDNGGGGWADLEASERRGDVLEGPTSLRVCTLCKGSSEMLKFGTEEEEKEEVLSDTASRRGSMMAESVMTDATYMSFV